MSYRPDMRTERMLAIPAYGMSFLCLLATSGCAPWIGIQDLPPIDAGAPNRPDGAPIDADPSAPDADGCPWSYVPAHVDPCAAGKPVPALDLVLAAGVSHVYDTNDGTLTSSPIPPEAITIEGAVHTLWVKNLRVESGATLRVTGDSALMIVASGEITVDGAIDASSVQAGGSGQFDRGPGSNPTECSSSVGQIGGRCDIQGGGGGGGGGFGGAGGVGGEGGGLRSCGDGTFGSPGGAGGTAVESTPGAIRGGCDGARGGDGEEDGRYGVGGAGGGAVHLIAADRIEVGGTIHAGGAGGYGAEDKRSGGGGGGSGGFIGVEAPHITIEGSAVLAANGGAGGGGTNTVGDATSGVDALAADEAASGGAGYLGGAGGDGSADTTLTGGDGGDGDRGGGGGGGGAGFIIFYQSEPVFIGSPTVSPPPKGT
jgi:hypothetical protein